MTADQFAYWLQGFAELNSEPPSAEQWQSIRDHLQTVFAKVTPNLRGLDVMPYIGTPMRPLRAECAVKDNHSRLVC